MVKAFLAFWTIEFMLQNDDDEQNMRVSQTFVRHRAYFLAIIQKPMERSYWVFCRGVQVGADLQVGQQKYLIAALDPSVSLSGSLHSSVPDLLPSHQQFTECHKCTMSRVTEEKEEIEKKYQKKRTSNEDMYFFINSISKWG